MEAEEATDALRDMEERRSAEDQVRQETWQREVTANCGQQEAARSQLEAARHTMDAQTRELQMLRETGDRDGLVSKLQHELEAQAKQADRDLQEVTSLLQESEMTIAALQEEIRSLQFTNKQNTDMAQQWEGRATLLYQELRSGEGGQHGSGLLNEVLETKLEMMQLRIDELRVERVSAPEKGEKAIQGTEEADVEREALLRLAGHLQEVEGKADAEETARFAAEERAAQLEAQLEGHVNSPGGPAALDTILEKRVLQTRVENLEDQLIETREEMVELTAMGDADRALLVEELRYCAAARKGSDSRTSTPSRRSHTQVLEGLRKGLDEQYGQSSRTGSPRRDASPQSNQDGTMSDGGSLRTDGSPRKDGSLSSHWGGSPRRDSSPKRDSYEATTPPSSPTESRTSIILGTRSNERPTRHVPVEENASGPGSYAQSAAYGGPRSRIPQDVVLPAAELQQDGLAETSGSNAAHGGFAWEVAF